MSSGHIWLMKQVAYSHADFVSSNDEGHFAAPGVDEAGPAGVYGDILSIPRTEPDGRVVKWLTSILKDYGRKKKKMGKSNKDSCLVLNQFTQS